MTYSPVVPSTKDKRIILRAKTAEHEQWLESAEAADLTLSEWIRQQLNAAARRASRSK